MKKTIGILLFIAITYIIIGKVGAHALEIPDEAIRMRVIPNSNSEYDQNIKLQVRDELQKTMSILLKNTVSIEEARTIIEQNMEILDSKVSSVLKKENYLEGYQINFGYNYFPTKNFRGVTYKEGLYESVVVTLGKGEGDNWWCVLFPPLCLLEAQESDQVEYKSLVQEILEKYL